MMKALIVTVAGTSSRFAKSLGRDLLKCIYFEGNPRQTLLYRLLGQIGNAFEQIVVVGGYRFDELKAYVSTYLSNDVRDRVELVENDKYAELASGWSLSLGLNALMGTNWDQVVFVEGDLFVDNKGVRTLVLGAGDAVTTSPDPVRADRSVALYFDVLGRPQYAYSESHGALSIPEPFLSIQSSGQAWRFADFEMLSGVSCDFANNGGEGTNLKIINTYFLRAEPTAIDVVDFGQWVNCNTVEDWRRAFVSGKGVCL